MPSNIELSELSSGNLPEVVSYAVLTPPSYQESGQMGRWHRWFFATLSAGMSYYVEDPDGGDRWESFIVEDFIPHVRATFNIEPIATRPRLQESRWWLWSSQDCIRASRTVRRCGGHESHARTGIPRFGGRRSQQAASLLRSCTANRPGALSRAFCCQQSREPRASMRTIFAKLPCQFTWRWAITISWNAHDGTEFLHRVLWDLDISHEYHLVRGGDHGGPTFRPRMCATFAWVSAVLTAQATAEPTAEERALSAMREQLHPLRDLAAALDPSVHRRFGILPRETVTE